MGERTKIRPGDKLLLSNKLFDGEDSLPLRCFATLRNASGTILNTVELTHVGGGIFNESTEVMPSIDVLFADHDVRETDGVTAAAGYQQDTDVYVRDLVGEIITDNLDAKVSTTTSADLTGEVASESTISGEVDEQELEGTVSSDETLAGVITDE